MAYSVPNVAGVPPLLGGFAVNAALTFLSAADDDFLDFLPSPVGPQWGIFLGGVAVVACDSVVSIDYKQEWVIADYPVEGGAFETYDRVQRPFDVRFRFSAGGNEGNRQALLASIAAIANTLTLYDFVSPEAIYQSVSIQHYDYHRTATSGAGLLVVDVWGYQVVVNTSSGLTNTASPASNDPNFVGPVQPGTPTTTQTTAATNGMAAGPV